MAIQKPYDLSIRGGIAIDADKENTLSWKSSGDLSVAFAITIIKNSDNSVVWSLPKTNSYAQRYVIPSGSIPNGFEYKIQVTAWNEAGQSASSDLEIFQTSSTPTVTMNAVSVIGTHDYNFTAIYSQDENVPLRSYIVYLYDSSKIMISQSGIKTTPVIEQYFSNMKSGETYYVEFQVTSAIGLTGSSGLIPFDVIYETPVINIGLVAENYDNASIKLNWNVVQIIGKVDVFPPTYIDDEMIDLRDNRLVFDEGFTVEENFTLRIWIESPEYDTTLMLMKGQNGELTLQYRKDNRFHLFKKSNGFTSHYGTPVITGDKMFLCIQQIGEGINMFGESY